MHDGLGFRNTRTGLNYTMEWYELDQLFNCTFPHVLQNESFIWCNQGNLKNILINDIIFYFYFKIGALCIYDGINDTVWKQYGTLEKVSTISGLQFNRFANWSIYDNNTAVIYETWTVYNSDDFSNQNKSLIMYFDSFDCASWVLR
jgi:ceroid-lipofuscinosis neuronal protein 5